MEGYKVRRGCRRRIRSCLFWCIGLVLLIVALFWLLRTAQAEDDKQSLAVWLLLDNSNSMFEKGGIGSDPDLLRIDASRLFLTYLGVDEPDLIHQAGVIFFGSEAEIIIPLTLLTGESKRAELFAQIANPARLGWTDHLAALTLAQAQISTADNVRPIIILLTDGKPQLADGTQQDQYIADLRNVGALLAEDGVSLFIVLLANQATDDDPDIANIWQPIWQELTAMTSEGQFFIVRDGMALPDIYHEIVVALTQRETAGKILSAQVDETGLETTLTVQPNLTQMTLVISKASPTQTVTIRTSDGAILNQADRAVRYAGGDYREEIWMIESPPAGTWTIEIQYPGLVTIWQDYVQTAVTPSPTATSLPTTQPTSTQTPTITPSLTWTVTPSPFPSITPMPIKLQNIPPPVYQKKTVWWPWLLTAVGICSLVWGYQTYKRQQPIVIGNLNTQPNDSTTTHNLDLAQVAKRRLTIGSPSSDIPLSGATEQAVFRVGDPIGYTHEIWLEANSQLRVNGQPLHQDRLLKDRDIIHIGEIQLRYENLLLRQAQRESAQGGIQ